ncbi:hypothetical protein QAD02_019263 [Eretmocerus hayati]|uniref:Uncharacterized protein n=1 Tax=Eretmocerus hayati TaxID=131215 RepID=A0ACC2PKY2_9HYME|nr:hypothetical protein QAD02_019263 [Eretmocerus hayati]
MFNDVFKYYKARKPPPELCNVIDLEKVDETLVTRIPVSSECKTCPNSILGLSPTESWNIFEFRRISGLFVIRNPFTTHGQQDWIIRCLKNYPKKPNITNIDAHDLLNKDDTWWNTCFGIAPDNNLSSKLRWATLGYHHNWDTKQYAEESRTEMPKELVALTRYFAEVLGFNDFRAEAAIVNYYRMNSTLAGHTDHSEPYLEAPLFSISFGQTAIFLIGGHNREDPADAIFLRSGDVIVMSGDSRLRYHGVPKILLDDSTVWDSECYPNKEDWSRAQSYISQARINLNIRQVLKPGQISL